VSTIKLSSPATREFWEIPVLFEDEHLLALDKPARLLATPDPDDTPRPSLMALLHAGITGAKPWASERSLTYLNNACRLDFDASGVILLAKTKTAFMTLADLFSSEKVQQSYLALVRGEPLEKQFEVDAKLSPHPVKPGVMRVDHAGGKQAKTRFEVLETFPRSGYALLKCEPLTGRLHQIRVHASYIDLKIAGDEIYGGKPLWLSRLKQDYRLKPGREERPLLGRAALHSEQITLPHPVTGESLTITAEWPKDIKVALKYLRLYATAGKTPPPDEYK
jgi:23S rRNA pseudouridine1911/1915/1917 synthase